MPTKDRYGKYGPLNDQEEVERTDDAQNTETPSTPATGGEPAAAAPTATETSATTAKGDGGEEEYRGLTNQIKSMEDAIALMRQRRDEIDVEDAEKRQQRERRESAQSFIGSVADMGRALANLHYTTQYAPSQQIGEGLSGKYRELYESKAKERDKNRALWDNYNAQLRKLDEAKGGAEAALDAAKQAQANWKYEQKAKKEADKNKLDLEYDKLDAETEEKKAKRAGEEADRKERERHNRAMEAAARARVAAIAKSHKSGSVTKDMHYVLPDGTDIVIPADKFRIGTLAEAFRGIDDDSKPVAGKDINGKPYTPTLDNMDWWIGSNLDNDAVVDALYRLEGKGRRRKTTTATGEQPGFHVPAGAANATTGGKKGGGTLLPKKGGSLLPTT